MSSGPSAEEIARDARWLVQAINPSAGVARLVEMDRDAYRQASFLDDRMMAEPCTAQLVPWTRAEEAARLVERSDAHWIFHIGHVGSTLISRLLGELPGVLAIREPRSLRDLAWIGPAARAPYVNALSKLMSRTFADRETACIKATSFVSEIAGELVRPGGSALFVTASPRNYIASILAGENSVKELHALTDFRARRMADRISGLDVGNTDAHRAAIAWACEMTALEASGAAMSDRTIAWLDFDAFLGDVPRGLQSLTDHFGFATAEADLTDIMSGPLLRRYSKAMEYDYSPDLRRELIAEADQRHRPAIDSALAMLDRAAVSSPLLKRALDRAGEIACSASSIS